MVKVIILNTSYDISLHNNYYRHYKFDKQLIPEIAYNIFKSKYEKPTLSEGINKIIKTGINMICIGITIIELSTGKIIVYEIEPKINDEKYSIDEL